MREEGGVVAEELLVQNPVGGVGGDVDVDHGVGEEPGKKEVSGIADWGTGKNGKIGLGLYLLMERLFWLFGHGEG